MQLVLPSIEYEQSFLEALAEQKKERSLEMERELQKFYDDSKDFGDFVWRLRGRSEGKFLPEGYVPDTFYWFVDANTYLGSVVIRHILTPHLLEIGGHIGYAIRPSERGKGYGTKILTLALPKAKELGITKVRITCNEDNVGSRKIIEKNGGVFDGTATTPEGIVKRRYWITLD